MGKETISELINRTKQILLNKHCINHGTLNNYEKNGFKHIRKYFSEKGCDYVSNALIERSIQSAWEAHQAGAKSLHQFHVFRKAAHLLHEVSETGTLKWHVLPKWNERKLNKEYGLLLAGYLNTINGAYSASTCKGKLYTIRQFLFFLEDQGIFDISKLEAKNLLAYIKHMFSRRPAGMGQVLPTIRSFLQHLKAQGVIRNDYANLLNIKCNRCSTIKPVFKEEEPARILASIDRTSARGKRDYAMFMLAMRNGLRAGDILNLKLSDIDWKNAEASIMQKKTGAFVTLPLAEETLSAIADYILQARPPSGLQYIFLKSRSPYERIQSSATLCQSLKNYMATAGIESSPGDWKSTHTFRRTLGTRMLESEVPVTTIMQVLGHKDPDSSKPYLSMSEKKLAECPLNLQGIAVTAEALL